MPLAIGRPLAWPFDKAMDTVALWRLRRLMPNAHRRLIWNDQGSRPETNSEYLDRLRDMAEERYGE